MLAENVAQLADIAFRANPRIMPRKVSATRPALGCREKDACYFRRDHREPEFDFRIQFRNMLDDRGASCGECGQTIEIAFSRGSQCPIRPSKPRSPWVYLLV